MGKVAGGSKSRTAFGFKEHQKRHIRRAEFLTTNSEYRKVIADCQARWNAAYPEYRLIETGAIVHEAPEPLHRALKAERERQKREGGLFSLEFPREISRPDRAMDKWLGIVAKLVSLYWPELNFPNPNLGPQLPAWHFVAKCLHVDPRTLFGDCAQFFQEFELLPVPMLSQIPETVPLDPEDDFAMAGDGLWGEVNWVIPLYPGITAKDLADAAPEIVRIAEDVYRNRTAGARVGSLRDEGLTYQQIADRLGLHVNTVASILNRTTE